MGQDHPDSGFGIFHECAVIDFEHCLRAHCTPPLHDAPVFTVKVRYRDKVVAPRAHVAVHSAEIGKADVHRITHNVQDWSAGQGPLDNRNQLNIDRQLVNKVATPPCSPLGLRKVALAYFREVELR